ncbi:lipid A core-O-antigen ligase-like enyme [Caulobacter sp. AP07]|uniref:O-antigen ligase family protein n=1 Tax=Caulobacter sp. AP07 TaxID=1144304 RepID=UPI000271ED98|nr:O-antigen ligase family protein [Caulobacter sp. AP07]EJL34045.1 lipid A core-O-antigen ligase-like enyme [Caulobacter sp. AP07]
MPTDTAVGRPVAAGDRTPRRRARRLAASEKVAALGLLALVFAAVLAFGASEVVTAVLFSGLYAAYLLGLLATCDWARRDLGKMAGLPLQAVLFALLAAAVLWPLTAWGPGGAHPVWDYLPGRMGSLTVDRSALLLNLLQLFGLASLYVSARLLGASEARGAWFLRAAVIALAAYAAMAIADHVGVRRAARLTATLLSPNSAATTFGAGLLLAVAAAVNRFRRYPGLTVLRRGDPEAMAYLGVVALLATVLLMTASRAGVVASLIGLGLLLVWNVFAQRQSLRGGAGLIVVAAVLLVAAVALRSVDHLADRFSATGRDIEVRSNIFAPHWEAFLSTPWSGFGLGAFPTVNQLIVTGTSLSVLHDVRAAHNLYLQWLEEGGVVGSLAMLALFVSLAWPILRGGLVDSAAGVWARAAVCAAVVFLVHGVTDFALQVPAIQALCVMVLGVVGGMALARTGARRGGSVLPRWPIGVVAGGTVLATLLAGPPLVAAKLGGDLSAWPTAPAEALAQSVETGLAAPRPGLPALARLERINARELALRPASGAAWLRRAAIEAELGHDEASSEALERSFLVAPLQSSLFDRRTVFAYEHWDRLSPAARDQTVYHLKAEWLRGRPARFVAMANGIRNPAGRVGLALQVAVLRMSSRVR